MKHPTTREFFAYWDTKRGDARAPDRNQLDPSEMRHLVADSFTLDCDRDFVFRRSGTRVKALLGSNSISQPFWSLFADSAQAEIQEILTMVSEESRAVVAGITAANISGTVARLELLLLPFAPRGHAPRSIGGSLAAFEDVPGHSVYNLGITSWRFLPAETAPAARALRKLAMAHGLTVYEGIRAAS